MNQTAWCVSIMSWSRYMTEHLWTFVIQSPIHPKLVIFSVTHDNSQQHWHSIAIGIETHYLHEHHSEMTADNSNSMLIVLGIYEFCFCVTLSTFSNWSFRIIIHWFKTIRWNNQVIMTTYRVIQHKNPVCLHVRTITRNW